MRLALTLVMAIATPTLAQTDVFVAEETKLDVMGELQMLARSPENELHSLMPEELKATPLDINGDGEI